MRLTSEDQVVQDYLNDESEELEHIVEENIKAQHNEEAESHLELTFLTTWEDQIHGCLDFLGDNNITGEVANKLVDSLLELEELSREAEDKRVEIENSLAILRITKDAYLYSIVVENQLRQTL